MSAPAITLADAEAARRAAASILHESRFHSPSVPRPLHGVLHAIGGAVGAVGRAVVHAVHAAGRIVPGGTTTVWVVLGLAAFVATAILARRYSKRALRRGPAGAGTRRGAVAETAIELEREAARAEGDGRYGDAVRLRFRAGLIELAERGTIVRPRSTPAAEVARKLGSEDFDALARRFDEIAYGAAPAAAEDAEEARSRWAAVVAGSGRS
jgi:hypothetical protein